LESWRRAGAWHLGCDWEAPGVAGEFSSVNGEVVHKPERVEPSVRLRARITGMSPRALVASDPSILSRDLRTMRDVRPNSFRDPANSNQLSWICIFMSIPDSVPCVRFPVRKPKRSEHVDPSASSMGYFRVNDDARIAVNRVGTLKKWRVYAKNNHWSL
jgi:hypothetical protein